MNYRHAFHAGNFADVVKHAIFARVLERLAEKPAPFRVLDTHAGIGLYDLGGDAAGRTGEWRRGIARIAAPFAPEVETFLAPYRRVLAAVRADAAGEAAPGPLPLDKPGPYPGSPEIAARLLRAGDRAVFVETHRRDHGTLAERYRRDRRVLVPAIDGWAAPNAYLPPPERRGVVLVDPPYEAPDEFARLVAMLQAAHRKWPTGLYLLWYPIADPALIGHFRRTLVETGIPKILAAELDIYSERRAGRLGGTGMILVNPPWRLDAELAQALPALAARLGQEPGAGARIDWLAGE